MMIDSMRDVLMGIAAIPFIYYALALVSSVRFFLAKRPAAESAGSFEPPISNLKPVRGLDPDAYENYASFCRQDYPN
jgi:ceramide glucosyltransferase